MNTHWLTAEFVLPDKILSKCSSSSSANIPPSRNKSFEQLSDRQKRRKTEALRNCSDEIFDFVMSKKFKSDDVTFIIDFMKNHPEHFGNVKNYCENLLETNNKQNLQENEKMLALYTTAKLTRYQYNAIRENAKQMGQNFYPGYYTIQKLKKDCYPPEESITITEIEAKINLQDLLDHTASRFVKLLSNKIDINITKNFKMILKWGCDGASSQSIYKQIFRSCDKNTEDSSIFISSLVPIKLYDTDNNVVIWQNDKTSSTRFCRPIQFKYAKESKDMVTECIEEIKLQINSLNPYKKDTISVHYDLLLTMIDGKICNIITNTSSSMRCYICNATPKEMNNLNLIRTKTNNNEYCQLGLSTLHCLIRTFECLIHIAYRRDFKSWQVKSTEHKKLFEERKKQIQNEFRSKVGLVVDKVKQGLGTSNDGNTARKFFAIPEQSAEICKLDANLIKRFAILLQTISCRLPIHTEKFDAYAKETAEMYVTLYDWYPMPVTVHKLLMHGSEIIQHMILPIGQLSEDAQEANHKYFRSYRELHSRKISRIDNNRDVLNNLLINSDPIISSLRSYNIHNSLREILPEAESLLLLEES